MSTTETDDTNSPNRASDAIETGLPNHDQMTGLRNNVISLYNLVPLGEFDGLIAQSDGNGVHLREPRLGREKWSPFSITIQVENDGPRLSLTRRRSLESGYSQELRTYSLRPTAEESTLVVRTEEFDMTHRGPQNITPGRQGEPWSFSMKRYVELSNMVNEIIELRHEPPIVQASKPMRNGILGRLIGKVLTPRA